MVNISMSAGILGLLLLVSKTQKAGASSVYGQVITQILGVSLCSISEEALNIYTFSSYGMKTKL